MRRLVALFSRPDTPINLHIGCGSTLLRGWINVDRDPRAGADRVLDVRRGLPWRDGHAEVIFAEHFIEHLTLDEGLAFLGECRRVLHSEGVLRLSTPNLDWVHAEQYRPGAWRSPDDAVRDCFAINKGFRGWGHQFLYNLPALTEALESAGFREISACRYGESSHPLLRDLEKHEKYPDTPELPHVIIVEASGRTPTRGSGTFISALRDFASSMK